MVCGVRWFSWVGGSFELFGEGDRGCVQCGFPPDHPACPAAAGGVKRSGYEMRALQHGLLVREVSACSDGPVVVGVDRRDRVGRADQPTDFDVVFQEGDELRPRSASQVHDRWIPLVLLGGELFKLVLCCVLGRGGVDPGAVISRSHLSAAGWRNRTSCG